MERAITCNLQQLDGAHLQIWRLRWLLTRGFRPSQALQSRWLLAMHAVIHSHIEYKVHICFCPFACIHLSSPNSTRLFARVNDTSCNRQTRSNFLAQEHGFHRAWTILDRSIMAACSETVMHASIKSNHADPDLKLACAHACMQSIHRDAWRQETMAKDDPMADPAQGEDHPATVVLSNIMIS